MKKVVMVALTLVFALGLSINVGAQTSERRDMNQPQGSHGYGDRNLSRNDQPAEAISKVKGDFRGTSLIGARVENRQGDYLGEISDLALNLETNRVDFAVLSHGGLLGIKNQYVAIPLHAFSVKMDHGKLDRLVLDMSKEKLAQAPSFFQDQWPNRVETEKSYRYFGQTPYWQHGQSDSTTKTAK
ncbi:MAG TPA: PRC-barrel domain-containing protein [Thermodesulfobacteriota bacterium]|nr:PRC-barrel domain-containing protein [Thermodesulfobacteriota bacterium]